MIAERIKELRQNANLTQTELAKRLGLTRSSINAWEMGISTPSTQYIVELANLFHVSTDYLLGVQNSQLISFDSFTEDQRNILFSIIRYFNEENQS